MNTMAEKRRARILVIDDDPQNIALVQAQLERAGYQVSSAPSGRTGLESVANRPPD